jgi:hypothetical protein
MTRGERHVVQCKRCGRVFAYTYRSGPARELCARCQSRSRTQAQRGTSTQRGMGSEHQKRRARMLPLAYGMPCPLCGIVMHPWHRLDLDHVTPLALGGTGVDSRITHALCNRQRGSRLGHAIRRARTSSRDW